MPSLARCAFCQSTDIAMSREHVLPGWLLRYLEGTTGPAQIRMGRGRAIYSMREVVTRRVCTECNSGWMASLEDLARPLMLQMMKRKVWLEPVHQAILARWAVKTMLTAHLAVNPRASELWLSPAAFREFQSGPISMPDRLTVLLGAYEGEIGGDSGVEPVQLEVRRTAASGAKPTLRLILQVHAIVFHVLIVPRNQTMHLTIPQVLTDRLHLIWPPQQHATVAPPMHWPPPSTFDRSTLHDIWDVFPALGEAPHRIA
jgi:hypothetical protein